MLAALFLAAAAAAAQPAPPPPLPLSEAFRLAREGTDLLAEQEQAVAIAEARIRELRGTVLPDVTLRAREFRQEDVAPPAGVSTRFTQDRQHDARINAVQPLFAGFRDYLALKAAKREGEAARHDLARARGALFLDVTRAWLDLAGAQRETAIRRSLSELTARRLGELKERIDVGRSRPSEALAAEAQHARLRAGLEGLAGALGRAQESLRFLTGAPGELAAADPSLPEVPALDAVLERSRTRPEVEAARARLDSEAFLARAARRERWPVLSLGANYWLDRTGANEDVTWDVQLDASLPLFKGGAISGRVEQAAARRRAAEAALRLASLSAETEVRAAWRELDAAVRASEALRRAVDLAERNAKAQAEDYRLGLVTNLDVIGALDSLQETRLAHEQGVLTAVLAAARLEVAAGGPR